MAEIAEIVEVEADPAVAEERGVAPVMLTYPHLQPVTSTGPMDEELGSVLIGTPVPGGITSHPAPRTIGTLWQKLK